MGMARHPPLLTTALPMPLATAVAVCWKLCRHAKDMQRRLPPACLIQSLCPPAQTTCFNPLLPALHTLQPSEATLRASSAEAISFWLMLWLFVVWLVVVALIQALFAVLGAALVGAAVLFLAKINPQAMAKAALALTVRRWHAAA